MTSHNEKEIARFREAARTAIEEKLLKAYEEFKVEDAFQIIQNRLLKEAETVTNSLLGIDTRWHEIEIKEGALRDYMKPLVDDAIRNTVGPRIEEELTRVLAQATINKAINKKVKAIVDSCIYNIDSTFSDTGKRVDRLVNAEIDKVFAEWTANNTN